MSEASSSPIRIETSDLYSPTVNEFVDMQQALRRDVGPINPQPLVIRVIYFELVLSCDRQRSGSLAGLGHAGALLR